MHSGLNKGTNREKEGERETEKGTVREREREILRVYDLNHQDGKEHKESE